MGCDIHIHWETRKSADHDWMYHELQHFEDRFNSYGRNYLLFGLLANVRSYAEENAQPKGLPDDISATIKAELANWGEDAHSRTWYTIEEFKKIITDYSNKNPDAYMLEYNSDIKELEQTIEHLDIDHILLDLPLTAQARILIWFDS